MAELGAAYVIQLAVTIGLGICGYLMQRSISSIDKKLEENDDKLINTEDKIGDVKKELNEFKIEVSKEYVTKSDFNETTGQIMSKLDKIMDLIMEINKREK